jgi:hypothetical protein
MPFDAATLTHFWENTAAMGIINHTQVQLVEEGIENPEDLAEFDEKGLEKIFKNLANPAKIPIAGGRLQEINAYMMSGKSKMQIEGARKMAKFYETIGRPLDPDNMSWVVIKNFLEQHNALKDRKSSEETAIPKITKNFAVHHWLESFHIFLGRKVGVRQASLTYVVREESMVDVVPPPCAVDEPHLEKYGSIKRDQANCLSHTHALFKINNAEVFDMIEMAVCGSEIGPTVAPFVKSVMVVEP